MSQLSDLATRTAERSVEISLVDCDSHPTCDPLEVAEFIPEPWRSRYFRSAEFLAYPEAVDVRGLLYLPPVNVMRGDATPPGGGFAGSDPAFFERQLFAEAGVDLTMLIPLTPMCKLGQPDLENAMYVGVNRWIEKRWLSRNRGFGRFRGVIRVCPYDVRGAVAEIERWAGHPYFSQVYIVPEAAAPFGQAQYAPIFEAAARAGLPVALHVNRTPGMRLLTPVGFPSYHLEIFPQWPLYFMSHIASLIFEGVFDRLPELRVVCIEGGFTWLAPLLWRLDRYWEALGRGATGATRRPSEYAADHIRLTTQPLEEPEPADALLETIEWIGGANLLLYASDYPHYDFDDPAWTARNLPEKQRARILAGNAIELYGLPSTRPLDAFDEARAATT